LLRLFLIERNRRSFVELNPIRAAIAETPERVTTPGEGIGLRPERAEIARDRSTHDWNAVVAFGIESCGIGRNWQ